MPDDDASTTTVLGIDEQRVSEWFGDNVVGAVAPLHFTLIAGGLSNLTFLVRDAAGSQWVLRRPPLGKLLPTAHDVEREYRILNGMRNTPVPVPNVVALCADVRVNDAPFYVMEMVDGVVLRSEAMANDLFDVDGRRLLGFNAIDVLAEIHAVDVIDIGLGDLAKSENYVTRQITRWMRQIKDSTSDDLSALLRIGERLAHSIPSQQGASVVHGDFRLDNCIIGFDASIKAVLDWELCTLGDPLADVGLLMVYWTEPGEVPLAIGESPTTALGFPSRADLLQRYAELRDVDLADINFYIAFSYWRLACIFDGVALRYRRHEMGEQSEDAEIFERRVHELADSAVRSIEVN